MSAPPPPGSPAPPDAPRQAGGRVPTPMSWRSAVRLITGLTLLLALIVIAWTTRSALEAEGVSRSLLRVGRFRLAQPAAVNAALIYAQASFQTLVAIGVAVAVYVLTRIRD